MDILIATSNPSKLQQFKNVFAQIEGDFNLYSLDDLEIDDDVEEDQPTVMENAVKKATFFSKLAKMPALSDDFGIFVDALGGDFPGVFSRRWMNGSDEDRCYSLIEKLESVPDEKRVASYIGAVVLCCPKRGVYTSQVNTRGRIIAPSPSENWFGYDPIFYYPRLVKTFSQFSQLELDQFGHRGVGVRRILLKIKK
ncbi:non-canonical purine NTP pyrophosphatase [Patescibacteria group bacterium]